MIPNQRLNYIDLFRAFSILLVTSFHLWRYFGRPSFQVGEFDLFMILERGRWGVELFFFISGYCMALVTCKTGSRYADIDWKEYCVKRFLRIVPAYYVAIIVWSILIYNGIAPKPIGLIDQLSHLLFVHTFNPSTYYSISGVFWSLGIEMQFYLLLPIIFYYLIKFPILVILLCGLPMLISTFYASNFLLTKTVFAFLIYFVLGFICFNKMKFLKSIFSHKIAILILIVSGCLFLFLSFYKATVINGQIHMFFWVFSIIPFFVVLSDSFFVKNSKNIIYRLFVFTGTASYSIYLYNYIFYIDKKPFAYGISPLIFYLSLIYGVGIFMYYLVELPSHSLREWLLKKFIKFRVTVNRGAVKTAAE